MGEPKVRDWLWAYRRVVSGSLHEAVNFLMVVIAYMLSGGETMLERSSQNGGPF